MKYAQLGSISTGTLRTEDLLEAFASELEYQVQRNADEWCSDAGRERRDNYVKLIDDASNIDPDDEDAAEIVTELENALQDFAPAYCYFGAVEGDGADFGFWFAGMDALEDLPRVSDPSETEQHLGEECVFVNDHGNVTVYGCDGKPVLEIV
jgi:hypothetical protein